MGDFLPRHTGGHIDWPWLIEYYRQRIRNRGWSRSARKIRAESDAWRIEWRAAGCPPVGHPDCPPTPRQVAAQQDRRRDRRRTT